MSWSVNAKGSPAEVKAELARQFAYPLAEGVSGLADEGERETVRRVSDLLSQCLDTFDPEQTINPVVVSANGHMGWSDYTAKKGAYQAVTLEIHLVM